MINWNIWQGRACQICEINVSQIILQTQATTLASTVKIQLCVVVCAVTAVNILKVILSNTQIQDAIYHVAKQFTRKTRG